MKGKHVAKSTKLDKVKFVLVGLKTKGCIAEVISDPLLDCLKLECLKNRKVKKKGEREGRLASRRRVSEARLY